MALFLFSGEEARDDLLRGLTILLKRRGCPPVLHLTVILSFESADWMMRFSCVRYFSSSADKGVGSCSMGLTAFCFSNGDVAVSTVLNRSSGDVCISAVLGTFAAVDVDVGYYKK